LVTVADPRVTEPSFRRFYLTPSRSTGEPGEAEALDVLADILGGGATSRLYRQLVVDKGIAASAGAGYDSGRMGDTVFSLYGTPRGGTTLDQLAAAFDTVVADLVAKGVTDDELQRAIEHARADAIYSEDSPGSLARAVGGVLATGGTLADVQSMPARIAAVTADQVVAAARKYLTAPRSVTGYLVAGPAEGRS
jgi:zinc protease